MRSNPCNLYRPKKVLIGSYLLTSFYLYEKYIALVRIFHKFESLIIEMDDWDEAASSGPNRTADKSGSHILTRPILQIHLAQKSCQEMWSGPIIWPMKTNSHLICFLFVKQSISSSLKQQLKGVRRRRRRKMNTDITASAKPEYPVIDRNPPFTKTVANFNTLDYLRLTTIAGVSVTVGYLSGTPFLPLYK